MKMRNVTVILIASLAIAFLAGFPAFSQSADSADAHIKSVTAITRVYADGLKVAAIAVEYDKPIKAASLSPSAYSVKTDVEGQSITGIYTSADKTYFTRAGASGPYVVLELSTGYVIPAHVRKLPTPRAPNAPPPTPPSPPSAAALSDLSHNPEVLTKVGAISWEPAAHPSTLLPTGNGGSGKFVLLTQTGTITAADGKKIGGSSSAIKSGLIRNMTVDGFMKPDYRDSAYGNLKYNIHFPRNYDPNKKYPLVVFLADQSESGETHADALILSNGGTVWAEREEEARHEAIVVVPLAMRNFVNDKYEPAAEMRQGPPPTQPGDAASGAAQATPARTPSNPYLANLGLMDFLLANFPSIDRNRIYLTGQGDGARAAIKMMLDRPGLFAAALLFAPDYDPARMAALSKANLWIVSAEEDNASFPKMSAAIDALKTSGATVSKAEWSAQGDARQIAASVNSMIKQGGNIKFAVLKKGTVVPSGAEANAVNIHAYTWRTGYSIQALRDWMFAQKK